MTEFIERLYAQPARLYRRFLGLHPYFRILTALLILVTLIGFFVAASLWVAIFFADAVYKLPVCFRNKCLEDFYAQFASSFAVAKSTFDLMVVVTTVGAMLVALMSYLSSLKSSQFTNHVSHLTLFQAFFVEEIKKRDLLSISSFDSHKIYGLIYSSSRGGDMSVSESYFSFVRKVNSVVLESNFKAFKASSGPFIYKEHQSNMIEVLREIGFDLQFMPKKDFYEIETQIFSLIGTISNSFCGGDARLILEQRLYR